MRVNYTVCTHFKIDRYIHFLIPEGKLDWKIPNKGVVVFRHFNMKWLHIVPLSANIFLNVGLAWFHLLILVLVRVPLAQPE